VSDSNDPSRPREFPDLDFGKLRTYSVAGRKSLVDRGDFAGVIPPDADFRSFFDSLPRILAGRSLHALVDAIVEARRAGALVAAGLGGHVLKVGLSPLLVDLMERGILGAVALNGAGAIHDLELAMQGCTSEDVAEGIRDGSFGMARETAEALNRAACEGRDRDEGLGRALGRLILERGYPHAGLSVSAAAARLGLPLTVHVTVGAEITHMSAEADGAAIGEASFRDFRILSGVVASMDGGVWLNVGSAVVLPEVFLKAINVARNLGHPVKNLTTANLDMLVHYRPRVNVVERPSARGYNIIGHHEILIPLLRMGILSRLEEGTKP
jgi:hypothetical protein